MNKINDRTVVEFLIERSKNGEMWFVKKFNTKAEAEECINALREGQPEVTWVLTEKTTTYNYLS